MDHYRYFIFNQRQMVVLGLLQVALSTVCVVSGFIDGVFRAESELSKTRAPVWAGMVMGIPGVLALFSSQRKNPILKPFLFGFPVTITTGFSLVLQDIKGSSLAHLVNAVITASVISCATILIVIVYSSLTLSYGEEELNHLPIHAIHTKYVLNKVVKGANIAMLIASVCSAFVVLVIAYLGCRSLPHCSCYDSVTGMEWLQPTDDQIQAVEMICAVRSPRNSIFNTPVQFPVQDLDTEEDVSKPPPYIRMA